MTTWTVEAIYYGRRETMIAEVSAFDVTGAGVASDACEYLIMPVGDAEYDTEYCATAAEARAIADELAAAYGVKVVAL